MAPSSPMPNTSLADDRAAALELIRSAHAAELLGNFKEAFNLHTRGGNLLIKAVAKGKRKSEERSRDKLILRICKERRVVLRPAAEGNGPPLAGPLPSQATKQNEIQNRQGKIMLSNVESRLWGSLADQQDSFEMMIFDENSIPYFTPMLPPSSSVPELEFHVYIERFSYRRTSKCYLHIKDATKNQTLYSLHDLKLVDDPDVDVSLSRATEYNQVCNTITYRGDGTQYPEGRSMEIRTSIGSTVIISPGRMKKEWLPRRFTYGGRKFVWKGVADYLMGQETLYEVISDSPVEGSKTGKRMDKTFERAIAWVIGKNLYHKVCTIGMVGGLDQTFQEFVVASVAGKIWFTTPKISPLSWSK